MNPTEQMQLLAKEIIITALRDLIKIKPNGKGEFKYCGRPYVDNKDNMLYEEIDQDQVDLEMIEWFESTSRKRYSYQYWLAYAELNPIPIRKYINNLKIIAEGGFVPNDIKPVIDRCAEPEEETKIIARGYLPYVKTHPHSRKWVNV